MDHILQVGQWQDYQLTLDTTEINLDNAGARKTQGDSALCSCDHIDVASLDLNPWVWSNHGAWATVVLALAAIFGVLAIGIGVMFVSKRYYVIQGASFSLSLWLLLGVILMYLLNLAYMFDANPAICGIRRFGTSFVYCVVYAAMLVKSIRVNRFARKEQGEDLNFAGSWSQTLLFLAFLLPEVVLVVEWLLLIPPKVSVDSSANACVPGPLQVTCAFSSTDLTIFMLYSYFLVLVTLLSSMGVLRCSKFQHEGKSLFVSSLFSSLILIAWACVYNLAEPIYSIPAIPVGLTADATIILIFMFLPKVSSIVRDKVEKTDKEALVTDKAGKTIHVHDYNRKFYNPDFTLSNFR